MDLESLMNAEVRKFAVQKVMFCPVTNEVLDVRTAVIVESADGEHVLAVVSPTGWAQRKDTVMAMVPGARVDDPAAPPEVAPWSPSDEFMCTTCGFSAIGTRDERDDAHMKFDGAHEGNWVRESDEASEQDIPMPEDS